MTGSTDDARRFYDAEIRAAMAGRGRGLASRRSTGSTRSADSEIRTTGFEPATNWPSVADRRGKRCFAQVLRWVRCTAGPRACRGCRGCLDGLPIAGRVVPRRVRVLQGDHEDTAGQEFVLVVVAPKGWRLVGELHSK